MKKRIVACVLSVALMLGTLLLPMSASAATVEDVYAVFKTFPMAEQFDADAKKLMDIVPVTSEQADKLIEILNEAKKIITAEKGTDPKNYSDDDVRKMFDLLGEACGTVNVEYKLIQKANAISEDDSLVIEFYYNGKKIYEYDGDVISKTGSDISPAALYTGFVLIAASVVALLVVRKKVAA